MPPVVGVHEGVAVLPRIRHRLQEGDAIDHAAARLQAMGDDVMRPGIAPVDGQCLAPQRLGLVDAIALFQAEGMHLMHEAVLRVGRRRARADPQLCLGVAAVEGMELAELDRQQIARPVGSHLLVDRETLVGVAGHPGRRRGKPGAFAVVGVGAVLRQCLRAGEQSFGAGLAISRVHGEHQTCRHQRQQGRVFFFFRGGDELGQPVAEGQPFVAQEIERADCPRIGIADV